MLHKELKGILYEAHNAHNISRKLFEIKIMKIEKELKLLGSEEMKPKLVPKIYLNKKYNSYEIH